MSELFAQLFAKLGPMDYIMEMLTTIVLTSSSTLLAYIFGLPLAILLYGTAKGGIFPNKYVNAVVGVVVNVLRSIPFIILLVMTQPIALAVVGSQIGNEAFVFYLVLAATPFVARMIESSFREVDAGVIEAAQSMGINNLQLMIKVIIPEAKPSLITGCAIALTTILGYTPMTYLVGGSGLGQVAIQYGLFRFDKPVMYISSLLLIILVQVTQEVLNRVSKKSDKRIRNK